MSYKAITNKRPFDATKPNKPKHRKQKRGEDEEYDDPDESKPRPRPENKKLVFDDEGNTIEAASPKAWPKGRRPKHQPDGQPDVDTKWFQVVGRIVRRRVTTTNIH